jgi:hypothetical protein
MLTNHSLLAIDSELATVHSPIPRATAIPTKPQLVKKGKPINWKGASAAVAAR